MSKPSDYIGIQKWHEVTGSMDYYWEALQEKAALENAPLDAIYRGFTSKKWMTVGELAPDHSFHAVYKEALGK